MSELLNEYLSLLFEKMGPDEVKQFLDACKRDGQAEFGGLQFHWDDEEQEAFASTPDKAVFVLLKPQKSGGAKAHVKSMSGEFEKDTIVKSALDMSRTVKLATRLDQTVTKRAGQTKDIDDRDMSDLFGGFPELRAHRMLTVEAPLMRVLKQKFPDTLPQVGRPIAQGSEGAVFEHGSDQVIKVMVCPSKADARNVLSQLQRLKAGSLPGLVNVSDFGVVGRLVEPSQMGPTDFNKSIYVVWYTAERLSPAPEANQRDVRQLVKSLAKSGLKHGDFADNPDNIMQDKQGNLKIADLGRFLEPVGR